MSEVVRNSMSEVYVEHHNDFREMLCCKPSITTRPAGVGAGTGGVGEEVGGTRIAGVGCCQLRVSGLLSVGNAAKERLSS